MQSKFEKPQKGNPHQLSIRQHVWPLKSIARFVNSKGCVELFDKAHNRSRGVKPDNDILCVKRVWDQRAEAGYMKSIEDAFQYLAEEIVADITTRIDADRKQTIDAFFALWRIRADHRAANAGRVSFKNVTGYEWTKEQEEQFEKAGVSFLRKDGTMPARVLNGLRIQRAIDDYLCVLSQIRWGIICAQEGHLVVPDYPTYSIIPLTPTVCLCAGGQDGIITRQNVAEINHSFRLTSRGYFFAQELRWCP